MNTQVRAFIVISTVTLFGLATPAMAVVNWYNSSATDRSGGATVPIDGTTTTPSGWVDTFIGPNTTGTRGDRQWSQANGNAALTGTGATFMVWTFGDLGIAAGSTINSASLEVFANTTGITQTFTIYGLTGTINDSSTWTNVNLDTNTASNQYGTFSGADNTSISINLKTAIQAYIDGAITGVAIGTTEQGGAGFTTENNLQFATSENSTDSLRPSLMVDFVPEPSTYALIFGLVALVGVVRRRNNRSSSMPIPA